MKSGLIVKMGAKRQGDGKRQQRLPEWADDPLVCMT